MSDPGPEIDILVSEDVWGPAFEDLTSRYRVVRESGYWKEPDVLTRAVRNSRALVVRNRTSVDRALLTAGDRLTVVARAGVGLDNIDLSAADEAGVVVTAPLGANAVSVAEHTIGLALSLARGTVRLDSLSRTGGWNREPGRELRHGVWGLLGCGATARACGTLAAALGMHVLAYDPYLDPRHPALSAAGIELTSLERVTAESDVLSCHLPATTDTIGLVDTELLARLRPSALFVNVGRGEVVNEDALADALEAGMLAGAALDVRANEPPETGRLEKLDNVVLTPHIAGITTQSQALIARTLADDIDAVLSGRRASSAVGTAKEARS